MRPKLQIHGWKLRGAACLLVLTAVVGSSSTSRAQPEFSGLPEPGAPTFDLDYAAFRIGEDSLRLDIYYLITNPRLSYIRRTSDPGDSTAPGAAGSRAYYVAAYEITAILGGDSDPQAATVSRRENYRLETFEETRSSSGYLVNVLTMTVALDNFELTVTLKDRVSSNAHTVRRDVDLRQFRDSDWMFGGPEFFDPEATPPDQESFKSSGIPLVPNVKRSFAGVADRLAIYFEVHTDRNPDVRSVVVQADQRTGHRRFDDTLSLEGKTGIVPIVYRHALPSLKTGETRLRLRALDADGKQIGDHYETYFWIDWTIASMVHEDWEEVVAMLVHIATHDELDALRSALEDERVEAFEEFWRKRDPTPETPDNEWKQEYYRRIRFANVRFASAFNRGWRSDFGTIYVRYGEPDEIERHPFDRGQKPFQVWYYYGQRREFLFVDARGNGEYELQYPFDGRIR